MHADLKFLGGIDLGAAGTVSVEVDVNLLTLSDDDRTFVEQLLAVIGDRVTTPPLPACPPAPLPVVELAPPPATSKRSKPRVRPGTGQPALETGKAPHESPAVGYGGGEPVGDDPGRRCPSERLVAHQTSSGWLFATVRALVHNVVAHPVVGVTQTVEHLAEKAADAADWLHEVTGP